MIHPKHKPQIFRTARRRFLTFIAAVLLGVTVHGADAQTISLHQESKTQERVSVFQDTDVELNNTYDHPLHEITVVQALTGKRTLAVADIPPGQSINIGFSKEGDYLLCYKVQPQTRQFEKCIGIEVIAQHPV